VPTDRFRPEAGSSARLDVVICTFQNAAMLALVLEALEAQHAAPELWNVLVVDNNSRDDTCDVIQRHVQVGRIPGLRRVAELTQGLTPARRCGVSCSTAPWIAFVDDDCILDPDWVSGALDFARTHETCAGFGGRVVPRYVENPPAVLAKYGWAFAEQDLGETPVPVDCLVGAGMVVSRAALCESGWDRGPYFADRVGRRLVSGGDVEIALRLAGTGRQLWYTPACSLRHMIPAYRTAMPYLLRMTRGLGVSHSLAHALTWRGSRRAWARAAARDLAASGRTVLRLARRSLGTADGRRDALLATGYELGRGQGIARVAVLLAAGRCEFFAADRPGSAGRGVRRGHAIRAA
jgi:GT2 family glycosyltransferase